MEHTFTASIKAILDNKFGSDAEDIYEKSQKRLEVKDIIKK